MADLPEYLPFTNPATGETFGQVRMDTPETVQAALEELRRAFPAWSAQPVRARVAVLRQLQKLLIDSIDEITEAINQDCGKTRQDALIEVFITVDLLNTYLRRAQRWLKPQRAPSGLYLFKKCYVKPQPYGVVAVISPWNYPFVLSLPPMIGALLAGNTVALKPSEITGATGALIERLFRRIPELAPYVRVLHGDGRVGAALANGKPDYIFLTGSTATGRKVAQTAAETLTPFACELGGKDAMIVLEDANLPAAARWGVWGAVYNTGQSCHSVERVYVHAQVYDEFLRLALAEAEQIRFGYSTAAENSFHMGPITSPVQLKIIQRHLEDAVNRGARALTGGQAQGSFFPPTLLVDVDHTMLVMREETFGPLMPVMKVASETEAIALANDCEFGLGASIWSRDLQRAFDVAQRVDAASVIINDTLAQFGIPMLPFGGIKDSGYGRTHGKEGVLHFTRPFAYVVGHPPLQYDPITLLRAPGNYRFGKMALQLARGVTLEQRLAPVERGVQLAAQTDKRRLGLGLLGLAGLALGVMALRKKG